MKSFIAIHKNTSYCFDEFTEIVNGAPLLTDIFGPPSFLSAKRTKFPNKYFHKIKCLTLNTNIQISKKYTNRENYTIFIIITKNINFARLFILLFSMCYHNML